MKLVSKKNGTITIFPSLISAVARKIGFTPPTGMSATNVQSAIEEVNTKVNNIPTPLPLIDFGDISASSLTDFLATLSTNMVNRPEGEYSFTATWSGTGWVHGTFRTIQNQYVYAIIQYTNDMYYINYIANVSRSIFKLNSTQIS